jgi:peptide deformylase
MIKELVTDEAILSTPCAAATADDAELAQDLIDTMNANEDAVCLAANQIGVTKAVVVYKDDNEKAHVMYNPKVLMGLGPQKLVESCMTHEGESKVTRFVKVKVSYDELVDGALKARKRDFMGWEAQMIQHMCDHCKGKLV